MPKRSPSFISTMILLLSPCFSRMMFVGLTALLIVASRDVFANSVPQGVERFCNPVKIRYLRRPQMTFPSFYLSRKTPPLEAVRGYRYDNFDRKTRKRFANRNSRAMRP